MKLEELIGKRVVRIAPSATGDRSYMDLKNEITVLEVVDGIPLVKVKYSVFGAEETKVQDLNMLNDDKWINAENAFKRLHELKSQV